MNLSDVFKRVQRTFGDEANIQVTKDDVGRWCTDAQREIAIAGGLLQTTAQQNIAKGVTSVVFPSNLLALTAVSVLGRTVVLEEVPFAHAQNFMGDSPSGTPVAYYVYARTINFLPIPSDAFDVTLFYSRDCAVVSSTNEIFDLPVTYHGRILEYCMKQAYEMDENFEASGLKTAEMANNLSTQLNQENYGAQKTYPFITMVEE